MSRFLQRVVDFFDPRPSAEFQERMLESRKDAVSQSRASMSETQRVRREPVETLYDRIVLSQAPKPKERP